MQRYEHGSKRWMASYPDAARNFDDSSVQAGHMAEVVRLAASEYGARPAVSTQLPNGACATLTFEEIDRLTDDFATYLRETVGVQAGDVVAQMSPNCIDFLIVTFGVFKAGCICTNINPLYTAREMEHQLRDSKAKVLVVMDLFGDKVDAVSGRTSAMVNGSRPIQPPRLPISSCRLRKRTSIGRWMSPSGPD